MQFTQPVQYKPRGQPAHDPREKTAHTFETDGGGKGRVQSLPMALRDYTGVILLSISSRTLFRCSGGFFALSRRTLLDRLLLSRKRHHLDSWCRLGRR
jgi:hypothetical protein